MASWRDDARLPCGLRRCSLAPRGRSAALHCRRHHAPVARDPAHCRFGAKPHAPRPCLSVNALPCHRRTPCCTAFPPAAGRQRFTVGLRSPVSS
uniref:Uncharacterized protein n=1 Tax=Oryza nivara TaxID=4536 RepID=A0A0E0IHE0_ORYNI